MVFLTSQHFWPILTKHYLVIVTNFFFSLSVAEDIFRDKDQPLLSLSSTALQFQQLPISVFENNDIVNYNEIFIMAHRHP